jgi:hypothetical protein
MASRTLPAQKAKSLLETFNRNVRDLQVYSAKDLKEQTVRELVKSDHCWIVVGNSKWT